MNKPYPIFMLLFLLCALSFPSCLREDTDDCPETQVRVVVRAHDDVDGNSQVSTIENIHLYIFDENNQCCDFWAGSEYTYGQTYDKHFNLVPGNYRLVAWTNQGSTYSNTLPAYGPGDPAEQMIVAFNYPSGAAVTHDIPDLHHGMLTDARVIKNSNNEFTIIIRPNTYRLNFEVRGLPATQDDYSFTVTDNNSHYRHDNSFIDEADPFDYQRTTTFSEGELLSSMTVLRLTDNRNPQFRLSNDTESETLYADNLVEMIKKAYARDNKIPDFDNVFEYDILITFGSSLLDVSISVNGWGYSGNETEL